MNPQRPLLVLSLLLNAALVAGVVHFLRPAAAPIAPGGAPQSRALVSSVAAEANPATPAITVITNRCQWRELESTHYAVFIANLRAVGCPERTIRDLVLADLRAACHARQRAETRAVPFWTGGRARARWMREAHERERRLAEEYAALANRLLGVDWHPDDEPQQDLTEQAITRFLTGPLPDETFQRLTGVLKRFERLKSQLDEGQAGVELPEDRAAGQQLRAQLQRELAALLTPGQLEEFLTRVAAAPEGGPGLERDALDVSPAELRAICQARLRYFDPLQKMLELAEPSEADQEQALAHFNDEVRALLGEMRYADFERSQDDQFRALHQTLRESVGRAEIVKAYEVSRLAQAEAGRLAADNSLDADTRHQQLAQIVALTEAELRRVLGEKAFQQCREGKLALLPEVK